MSKSVYGMKLTAVLAISALVLLSAPIVNYRLLPVAEAQQDQGRNWTKIDSDGRATNFNPQTQITKDNVNFLELKWVFPFPEAPAAVGGYATPQQGSVSTMLVVDGIVYVGTNFGRVIAIDAGTGKVVWTYTMQLNMTTDQAKGLFINRGINHVHGFNYFDGKLFYPAPPCDVHIIDAVSGKLVRKISEMCSNVPGNQPVRAKTGYKGQQSYGPSIYEKGRVLIAPAGVTDESNAGARGFFAAYNIDTGALLWRFFISPPAGGDPDWAVKVRDKGWIQGVKASDIPIDLLKNDWGKAIGVQAGPGWGQWAVDEETGIIYVGTAQAAPDWNATYRPGPNLFSASVVALDAMTGEMKWFHQTTTHDLWDWDCAWNVVLGKIGDRKVVYKGCKNGIMYAFDAKDGSLVWSFNPPTMKRSEYTPFHANSLLGSGPKDNSIIGNWDPKDIKTLTRKWANEPKTDAWWQNPPGTGGIESDIALAYGNVYVATYNLWNYLKVVPVEPDRPISGGNLGVPAPEQRKSNVTIYALDAATGRVKWSFFIDDVGYRGGLIASGGVVYASSLNGNLYALDAETGKVVWTRFFGVGLPIPPTIAADAKGKMMLFQSFGGQLSLWGPVVPGAIIALGLPDKIPETQVVTKEVIKEVTKEVIKEIPKEITKTVTVETISPIAYAGIGVAIIIGVAIGVALGRRRKTV